MSRSSTSASALDLEREMSLLLACARATLDGTALEVTPAADLERQWQRALTLAVQHGLTPLLTAQVRTVAAHIIPPAIRAEMAARHMLNAHCNLAQTEELLRVYAALSVHGIEALTFKGPTLALLGFGDVSLREFSDLDILVHSKDAIRAETCLAGQGYRARVPLNKAWQENELRRSRIERSFDNPEKGTTVDLHWNLVPTGFTFSGNPSQVFREAVEVDLRGQSVRTITSETLVPYLCGHSAKHDWSQLRFVYDIAAVIKRTPALDWDLLQRRAPSVCTTRMLLVGLALAHRLAGIALPPELLRLTTTRAITSLLNHIVENWRRGRPDTATTRLDWSYIRSLGSVRDLARYAHDTLLLPTHLEWSLVTLPERLRVLYYPIRVGRLFAKHVLHAPL